MHDLEPGRAPGRGAGPRDRSEKLSDLEIADDVKAPNSHLALNVIADDDGNERQIMRFNMPFGAVGDGEFGTYFIGYASASDVIEQMLTNMFVGKPPRTYDRILDFSTALTGNLFFVPPSSSSTTRPSRAGAPTRRAIPRPRRRPPATTRWASAAYGSGGVRTLQRG